MLRGEGITESQLRLGSSKPNQMEWLLSCRSLRALSPLRGRDSPGGAGADGDTGRVRSTSQAHWPQDLHPLRALHGGGILTMAGIGVAEARIAEVKRDQQRREKPGKRSLNGEDSLAEEQSLD